MSESEMSISLSLDNDGDVKTEWLNGLLFTALKLPAYKLYSKLSFVAPSWWESSSETSDRIKAAIFCTRHSKHSWDFCISTSWLNLPLFLIFEGFHHLYLENFNLGMEFRFQRKDRISEKQCWRAELWNFRCHFKICGFLSKYKTVASERRTMLLKKLIQSLHAKYFGGKIWLNITGNATPNHVVLCNISPFFSFLLGRLAAWVWKNWFSLKISTSSLASIEQTVTP